MSIHDFRESVNRSKTNMRLQTISNYSSIANNAANILAQGAKLAVKIADENATNDATQDYEQNYQTQLRTAMNEGQFDTDGEGNVITSIDQINANIEKFNNSYLDNYEGSDLSKKKLRQMIEASGDVYTNDILRGILTKQNQLKTKGAEEYGNKKKYNANYYKKRKPKGFYALYIHYCYLLRVFPKKYPYQKLSPAIRADVRKMEEISNETRLLVRNNLKTDEQFFAFKEDKEKRLEELMDQRSKLWYKHKKSKSKQEKEEIKEQIDNLNKEINPLRKEVVLCKDIIERSKKMEQNLQELSDEKNQEKEVEKNEHIR